MKRDIFVRLAVMTEVFRGTCQNEEGERTIARSPFVSSNIQSPRSERASRLIVVAMA
jgi:hypothetical protein